MNRLLVLRNIAKLYTAFVDNITLAIMLQEWRKIRKMTDNVAKKYVFSMQKKTI